ncbi:molybdopterin-dependent oxidoreductase [bacterium]|nr:molybdopterin-dependent oxidoreductase [bacterium]MBU1883586.1 molybdopterin-dependent oxidoreductase [bacterium]
MKRRDFFKTAAVVGVATVGSSAFGSNVAMREPIDSRTPQKINFPEKRPMITHSNRPPLLEAPRSTFSQVITPNDEFFVRWHLPDIPTFIDTDKYAIRITGNVAKPYELTLKELKEDFEQIEVTAVVQCGGNSRSAFVPITGGVQWGSGAMGCAKWKGVRLKDVLKRAGMKEGSHWVNFNGMEKPAYDKTPDFVRELNLDELNEDVMIAYQMNDEDLPYLNGFPTRLIVPGYYSDSWVKMIKDIVVTKDHTPLFFMDQAYRIAANATHGETPDHLAKMTKPITRMNIKSFIGFPDEGAEVEFQSQLVVRGVAFDGGIGIEKVLISLDNGKTWKEAMLGIDYGRYAYRAFRYSFRPNEKGNLSIMAKAIDHLGQEQPLAKDVPWDRGGYMFNGIDIVTIKIV